MIYPRTWVRSGIDKLKLLMMCPHIWVGHSSSTTFTKIACWVKDRNNSNKAATWAKLLTSLWQTNSLTDYLMRPPVKTFSRTALLPYRFSEGYSWIRGHEMQQLQCNWSTKSIKPWNRDLGFINPRNHNISVITVLIRIRNLLICPQQKLIFVILKRFERQVLIFHCLNLRGRDAQLRWSGGPLRTSSHQHEASPSTLTMPWCFQSSLLISAPGSGCSQGFWSNREHRFIHQTTKLAATLDAIQ